MNETVVKGRVVAKLYIIQHHNDREANTAVTVIRLDT